MSYRKLHKAAGTWWNRSSALTRIQQGREDRYVLVDCCCCHIWVPAMVEYLNYETYFVLFRMLMKAIAMKMCWQIFTWFFRWPIFFFTFYSTPCLMCCYIIENTKNFNVFLLEFFNLSLQSFVFSFKLHKIYTWFYVHKFIWKQPNKRIYLIIKIGSNIYQSLSNLLFPWLNDWNIF